MEVLICQGRESTSVTDNINEVTVSLYAQLLGPETEAAKWNSPIINFIIYIYDISKWLL